MNRNEFEKWLLDNKCHKSTESDQNDYIFELDQDYEECFVISVYNDSCCVSKSERYIFSDLMVRKKIDTIIKIFHDFDKAAQFIKLLLNKEKNKTILDLFFDKVSDRYFDRATESVGQFSTDYTTHSDTGEILAKDTAITNESEVWDEAWRLFQQDINDRELDAEFCEFLKDYYPEEVFEWASQKIIGESKNETN